MNFLKIAAFISLLLTSLYAVTTLASPSRDEYRFQVTRVYDGDTFYIRIAGIPNELSEIGVRVRGVDTPERLAKCKSEELKALAATSFTYRLIRDNNQVVYLSDLKWDKYGGRINAVVHVGESRIHLASTLIKHGHARPYDGGKRKGWCE